VEALVYDRHMTRWDVVIVTLTAHASTTHTCICMYAQAKNWTGLLTMMHAESKKASRYGPVCPVCSVILL
jgi:hypothetical protein